MILLFVILIKKKKIPDDKTKYRWLEEMLFALLRL